MPVVVRVDTARFFDEDAELSFRADLRYPRLSPDSVAAVARVNRAIEDSVAALVARARPNLNDFTGDPETDRWITGEVSGSYGPTLLQGDLLSTRLDAYVYTGGAHGTTVGVPLNFDLRTGRAVRLGELFRPGTAYLDTLAALATARLAAARGGTEWMFEERVPPTAGVLSAFTLGPDSLTVFFPPYAIAQYAMGPSEVSLPYRRLARVLDSEGPVARRR